MSVRAIVLTIYTIIAVTSFYAGTLLGEYISNQDHMHMESK